MSEIELLEEFLRSRDIDSDIVSKIRQEKVGFDIVLAMTDEEITSLGLTSLGDRIALRIFCQQMQSKSCADNSEKLDALIARLKSKQEKKKKRPNHLVHNQFASRSDRRVEVGWLDYDYAKGKYQQVRERSGGGTRKLRVPRDCTIADLLESVKEIFFPDGVAKHGLLDEFTFEMGNFDGTFVASDETVESIYTKSHMKLLHLYMMTKKHSATSAPSDSCVSVKMTNHSEEDVLDCLPDLSSENEHSSIDTGTPTIKFRIRGPGHQRTCQNSFTPGENSQSDWNAGHSSHQLSSYAQYVDLIDSDSDAEEGLQDALLQSFEDSSKLRVFDPVDEKKELQLLQTLCRNFFPENSPTVTVVVHRRHLLQSAIRAFGRTDFTIRKPVNICFIGEDAVDDGGPRREFFTLLMKAIATEMGVFEGFEQSRIFTHNIDLLSRRCYHQAGQFLLWSVVNGGPGLSCLSPYMMQLMRHCSITNLEDCLLQIPDDDIQNIISQFLSVESEEDMTKTITKWESELIRSGVVNLHRLRLNDKQKIALDLITNHLYYRLSAEIGQFIDGLEELWPLCQESFTLSRTLFIASNTTLSFGRMRQLYAVLWSERGSNRRAAEEDSIYYFECFLAQCESVGNSISLGQILAFWTGTDREPPLGFIVPAIEDERQPLNKPLSVDFYDEKGRLPYASTCGLRLWIPVNVTEEEFNRLLIQAVVECVGFGKV